MKRHDACPGERHVARPRQRRIACAALLGSLALAVIATAAALDPADVRLLDDGRAESWERREFAGVTRYEAHVLEGQTVLRARSEGAASGLYLTRAVNLSGHPRLRWRWRVKAALDNPLETRREGDDFAARVYVVAAHPVMFWKTRAICYVWASSAPVGKTWTSPYTEAQMNMVLQSGSADGGRWLQESRDVAADFERLFGEVPERIDAVAIMTDTDNTGLSAMAWYDDVAWTGLPGER